LEVSNNNGNNSSDWQRHLLIKFNLSLIPSITEIIQANLYLYYYDFDINDTVDRNLSIRRVTSSWNESNITWSNRPTNSTTNTSNSTVPSSFGWMNWDVLSDVQDFISGDSVNFGWQIMDLYYWGTYDIPVSKFKSKETQTNYTPYLKIVYETPLIPYGDGPYNGNTSEEIHFNGSYLGAGIEPYFWEWDFGDGNTSNEQNATHIYSNAAEYNISLIIKDSNGKGEEYSTVAIIENKKDNLPVVEILCPVKGFYIKNNKILPIKKTIIIGDIDIQVDVSVKKAEIEKVEFYINDQLKYSDTTIPYSWTWDKKPFLRFRHKIEIIIYDTIGNIISQRYPVWRFL